MNYYLINAFGYSNKFYADNQFKKIIIKLCKKKVKPSSNAKSDKFLKKIIMPNVLFLWKIKEVITRAIWSTSHKNHYSIIGSNFDLSLLVKILVEDKIFKLKVGRNIKNTEFVDFFIYELRKIRLRGLLKEY